LEKQLIDEYQKEPPLTAKNKESDEGEPMMAEPQIKLE